MAFSEPPGMTHETKFIPHQIGLARVLARPLEMLSKRFSPETQNGGDTVRKSVTVQYCGFQMKFPSGVKSIVREIIHL